MHHTISDLGEAVGARTEEFEEAEVAEDLELLADFVGAHTHPSVSLFGESRPAATS
jgi:hypothetical protein